MSETNPNASRRFNYGTIGRLGVILPSGNAAVEPQFEALRPWGMSCHYTRLALTGSADAQLMAMTAHVEPAALLLKDAGPSLIAFHCTAVSTWSRTLEVGLLHRMHVATRLPVIATSQALTAALRAVGAKKLVLLSPYQEGIAKREQVFMEEHGFDVLENMYLALDSPDQMIAVPPEKWQALVRESDRDDADAVLVSCTAIRAAEAIDACEAMVGKPVVTSNSALIWYAARMLGIDGALPGIGVLGRRQIAESASSGS